MVWAICDLERNQPVSRTHQARASVLLGTELSSLIANPLPHPPSRRVIGMAHRGGVNAHARDRRSGRQHRALRLDNAACGLLRLLRLLGRRPRFSAAAAAATAAAAVTWSAEHPRDKGLEGVAHGRRGGYGVPSRVGDCLLSAEASGHGGALLHRHELIGFAHDLCGAWRGRRQGSGRR